MTDPSCLFIQHTKLFLPSVNGHTWHTPSSDDIWLHVNDNDQRYSSWFLEITKRGPSSVVGVYKWTNVQCWITPTWSKVLKKEIKPTVKWLPMHLMLNLSMLTKLLARCSVAHSVHSYCFWWKQCIRIILNSAQVQTADYQLMIAASQPLASFPGARKIGESACYTPFAHERLRRFFWGTWKLP